MRKRNFVVTAVLFSSLLSTWAIAQDDSTSRTLDEALVTANKFPSKTSLTGKVVTIIGREEIDRSSARDLSQLLSLHGGFTVTGANGSPGKDKTVFLRGATAEHTLIMIDGVPVFDPSGIGGHFDIRNIALANIERIEIVKGSQSTLYGSAAIAGVINIITKKTTELRTAFDGMISAGSNDTYKLHAGIRRSLENWNYFANYSFHKSRGINDAKESPGIQPVDRDGYLQHGIDVGAGLWLRKKTKLQPFFRFTLHEGDIDDGAFADELDFTYEQKSAQAGFASETILGNSRLHVNYSYSLIDRLYVDDSVLSRNGFDIYSEGIYKGHEHVADAYLHIPLGDRWKLTAGADYRYTKSDQSYESMGSFPYSVKYSGDSLHQQQVAVYSALNLKAPGGFQFEAGGRVNIHSEYGLHPVFNINPSYLVRNQWKLFANLSTGFRTPSVYQLFSEFGNLELEPEKALSFETGLQYFSPSKKWKAGVVYFRRNVDDILFFFTDPATFRSRYINQDRQRDHGVEVEGSWIISEKVNLRGFYNYLDGEVRTKLGGRDTTFNNLVRRPKHSFGISGTARICNNFTISSNLTYTGERKDLYFDPFLYTTVRDDLDEYFLWDLYAEYGFHRNKLRLFVDVRNITASRYTEISGFNTLSRNIYGGLRLHL
jgi:vitamin B12 transporter